MAERHHRGEAGEAFGCRQCGECCRWEGYVLLTDADIRRLAEATGLTEAEFIARHTRLAGNRAQLSLLEKADGACQFLEGNVCRVYAHRPEQCRRFPLEWSLPGGCRGGVESETPP